MSARFRTQRLAVVLICTAWLSVHAQTASDSAQPTPRASTTILPVIGSAPETGAQFGLTALRVYRLGPAATTRTSQQQIYAMYTAKSQARAFAQVERWTRDNAWHTKLRAEYQHFPLPYFGLGIDAPEASEEWYTSSGPLLEAQAQRRILPSTYVGGGARLTTAHVSHREAGRALESGNILGSDGGTMSQLLGIVSRDSRDNVISAHSGNVVQLTGSWANHTWGSDYDFSRYVLELQGYRSLGGSEHVVAAQIRTQVTSGTAPFDQLVQYGSDTDLRGYTRGRYRDNHGASAQVEYRSPFHARLGVVGFAGVGTVGPTVSDLTSNTLLPSYGIGLRALMNASQRSMIRIDYGRGRGSSGLYVALGQSF